MDYIRQMIDSDELSNIFNLPDSFKGRKVEVIILSIPEARESIARQRGAFGCLRKYADASLISKEN